MLNRLSNKKFPTYSEPSIVLTVILTSKNEVLQIIQTRDCLFYKWTISLLSIFTSFPSDESDYELQGSPAIFDISHQNIPLLKVCRWLWHIIDNLTFSPQHQTPQPWGMSEGGYYSNFS